MIATISEIISQIVLYTTIYALVVLGIILSGRTGIFNIAGEGIMLFAASVGYMSALTTHSWVIGFLAGAAAGGLLGFVLVFIHERLKVDQFILGISIVILGAALADLLYKLWFGTQLLVQRAPAVPVIAIPLLSRIPLLRGFFHQNVITYFMYVSLAVSYFIYYRTKKGLEIRAIGENPRSADVVGISVFKLRYLTTIIGGVFMGIGGAYLPMILTGSYSFELTAGRGLHGDRDRHLRQLAAPAGIAQCLHLRHLRSAGSPAADLLSGIALRAFPPSSVSGQCSSSWPSSESDIEFPAALGDPYSRE